MTEYEKGIPPISKDEFEEWAKRVNSIIAEGGIPKDNPLTKEAIDMIFDSFIIVPKPTVK